MNEDQPKAPRRHRRRTFYPHKLTVPLNDETYVRIAAAAERYELSRAEILRAAAERGLSAELDPLARLQRKANAIRQKREGRA
ncbi:MAG: hypothetical protein GDA41_04440 [Rhodospirillales bacterium]|nr:hypothetical protein [Rhodospirillales bacterium]